MHLGKITHHTVQILCDFLLKKRQKFVIIILKSTGCVFNNATIASECELKTVIFEPPIYM